MEKIEKVRSELSVAFDKLDDKKQILRDGRLKELFVGIRDAAPEERAAYGNAVNQLKQDIQSWIESAAEADEEVVSLDATAPFGRSGKQADIRSLLAANPGTVHPLRAEVQRISGIFQRMGFVVEDSREIDDEYHMFTSLNFPNDHPARDDYDTFMTDEGLVAPAHTSTMQNRYLKKYKVKLDAGQPIAAVVPDRVFRNEDLDATHEHTFYQIEGIYVDEGINVGNLIAVLKTYLSEYFGEELNVKIQPFYFPFTEPSFEFAVERPTVLRKDDSEDQKWLELGGCGMIHPNVLKHAGIDPVKYSGFAWGFGVERMVMMRHGIEDIRHFQSANLKFLRQFK